MATQRMTHTAGRSSSSCLRKYRILFAFGLTVLCVQVYLAHMFLGLEIRNGKSGRLASGEGGWSQPEEDEGQARGLRQLKLPPDKRVNKSAQPQRNRTARIKLDRKLLSFAPACDVTGREAVSAVTRAQSQVCKERIVNVTCLNQQGLLYPERIQSLCPNSPGFRDAPVSLGCYKDDKTLRILSSYYHVFKGNNSPERCAFMCLQSGYPYAGTEYSVECFCGVEQPSPLKRLPDSSCNMKCSGNPKQSCGGYLTINIFSTGIKKFTSHEARNLSLENDPRKPARIAYLLTVNGRGSRQVKRLISILYHPSHLFYIHVDARQDYLYREMLEVESSCESKNIRVARGDGLRHASIWGGASLLTTLLKSAQQMLALNHDWDFLVNLSESDFPVKTDARLAEFLGWNRGMNFVKSHGREVQRFIAKQGLDKTFVECEARMWRIGDRKLPNGIQIDGGSDWVALSRDFVEYVATENPDTLVAELLKVFRYTLLPAESFFHTVLRNSRFCDTYVDNNLHVTNWKRKLGCKCQYKAVVDWCGCSPNDFKVEDLPRLRNTADRNLFFARKFEPSIDQRIIDRLEEWLYPENANKTVLLTGYDSYWQSIYHRADLSPIPDDALLTVSQSLARIAFRKSTETSVEVRLIETTGFFRANRFVGVLVHAEDSAKERLEALVHQRRNVSVRGDWLGKVRRLEVSTDYDQKEQTFRNLVGSMGPHSSPALLYEFDGVVALQNVTVLWVDPRGTLADVNRLQLDETSLFQVGHVKPQLTDRLAVGTWRLYLATDTGAFLAKTSFLVVPLEYRRGERISEQTSVEVNNNNNNNVSTHGYHVSVEERKKWSSLIGPGDQVSPERDSPELDLRKRIDRLVYEHYDVVAVCQSRSVPSSEQRKLVKCGDTDWSSMSPDTKSDMRKICKQ